MHQLPLPSPPDNWHSSVAAFQEANPCGVGLTENKRWDRFVDEYQELAADLKIILAQNQHNLCAYCECEISKNNRQIEHIQPKSTSTPGHDLTLDFANMVLCCLGGTAKTKATQGQTKRQRRQNHCCGEAKGDRTLPISPYQLPSFPIFAATVSELDKELTFLPDADACSSAGISVSDVDEILKVLNLNTPQLKRARYAVWTVIVEEIISIYENSPDITVRDRQLQHLAACHAQMDNAYDTTAILCLRRWLPKNLQ